MTNDELYLREKVGQGNPFRVPEDYFEQLTSQVMSHLPEQAESQQLSTVVSQQPSTVVSLQPEKKARVVSLRRWLYAAACVAAIAVLGMTFMFDNREVVEQQSLTASATAVESDYMDEAADYALIDNAEIYACLAEN
ncbi:MAG: hypothetical protein IJS95_09305 [Prevotella sp.]|nr:hypothetical protein [Prevotella sp.]